MTLRNLQIFLAVAETGSMVKAAKQLYMTQPSISQVISEMEKTYNVELFERKNRALRLTPTGEKLVDYAKNALLAAKEAEDFLNYESSHPTISVGATPTIGSLFMSSFVTKLQESIPNLVHHVCIGNASFIAQELLNGEIDIALVEGNISHPEIESRPVIRDRVVLICSKNHEFHNRVSVDVRELEGQPLVVREKGSALRSVVVDAMEDLGITPIISWGSTDYDSIISAVKHNHGVGIVSERFSRKERVRNRLHICDLTGMDVSFNYSLAYREGRMFPESLMEFIRICEEYGTLNDILEKGE